METYYSDAIMCRMGDTGLCEMNSSVTGEFPAQGASNA